MLIKVIEKLILFWWFVEICLSGHDQQWENTANIYLFFSSTFLHIHLLWLPDCDAPMSPTSNTRLDKWVTAFSIPKNFNDLISIEEENPNDIQVVHGLRFMMAMGLMFTWVKIWNCRKFICVAREERERFLTYISRDRLVELVRAASTLVGKERYGHEKLSWSSSASALCLLFFLSPSIRWWEQ